MGTVMRGNPMRTAADGAAREIAERAARAARGAVRGALDAAVIGERLRTGVTHESATGPVGESVVVHAGNGMHGGATGATVSEEETAAADEEGTRSGRGKRQRYSR